jgi:putative hemolysin
LETEPSPEYLSILNITLQPISAGVVIAILVMLLLLVISALVSGSEVAFFSLSPNDKKDLESRESRKGKLVLKHLNNPEYLLATILVANNLVNVGVVMISTYIMNALFDFSQAVVLGLFIQVIVITFLLLLFGEILPKIYANNNSLDFSRFMSGPLQFAGSLLRPVSSPLARSTRFVNKRFAKKQNLSIDDLTQALELASNDIPEDRKILKGIVKFGNIEVKEIMCSRIDIFAVSSGISYRELMKVVQDSGYSRIPVYEKSLDDIIGILYIKDLLPFIDQKDFAWESLIRVPFYVPENKKISDLLSEFQASKTHLAMVIDEYGGTSGLISMEDILEEIVGEISDESDEEELEYTKIDENNYLFQAKILLNDFYKVLSIKDDILDDVKGDAETLAGLLLELRGEFPRIGDQISYKNFIFKVKEVDQRRIKLIHVTIIKKDEITEE